MLLDKIARERVSVAERLILLRHGRESRGRTPEMDAHYRACLYAGVKIAGTNGEVMPGQVRLLSSVPGIVFMCVFYMQ